MSILDKGKSVFPQQRDAFPETEADVKKLLKVIIQATKSKEVQQSLIQAISNSPDKTTEIVAKMAAMLSQRIIAQIQEDMQAPIPEQNVIGIIMTLVHELYSFVQQMGGPPVDDTLVKETTRVAVRVLDEFAQAQQEMPQQEGM